MPESPGKVYFIGGGPGDPELLTLKAVRLIQQADLVLYADSLVHPDVCKFARPGAAVHGSKSLTLEEIVQLMVTAARQGKTVARIHSGDPSIYGATLEQMRILRQEGVAYEVVPGVSSMFAAAARLGTELTAPEVSQTVIVSRAEGRVAMPAGQDLRSLASHRATLVLFLSVARMGKVVRELLAGGYPKETPVAVAYRVTWPEEQIITGTLEDIAAKVRKARITLHALVMVGQVFDEALRNGSREQPASHLYSRTYTHLHRRASTGQGGQP